MPTVLGCWITRVGVRCYVGCWKPNDLTRVGLILTCWNSNACWTENVSVIVRFKDVLFCSMLDTYFGRPTGRPAGWPAGRCWMLGVGCWSVGCSMLCSDRKMFCFVRCWANVCWCSATCWILTFVGVGLTMFGTYPVLFMYICWVCVGLP